MAFANDKPVNHITWPSQASSGKTRMVVGADTPAELVLYGIQVAMLFYVVDVPTNKEVGYFFVALSNMLDFGATNNTCLFGEVVYPTPGVASSATFGSVKTHFQMTMGDPGSDFPSTRFKDFPILFNDTVSEIQFHNALTTLHNQVNVMSDATLNMVIGSQLITNRGRSVVFVSGTAVTATRTAATFGTVQVLGPVGSGVSITGNSFVIGKSDEYTVGLCFRYASQAAPAGIRLGNIFINGVDYMQFDASSSEYASTNITVMGQMPIFLLAGDVVTFQMFHTAGVNLGLTGNSCVWIDEHLA